VNFACVVVWVELPQTPAFVGTIACGRGLLQSVTDVLLLMRLQEGGVAWMLLLRR
jgi:hypothetical protein